MHGDGALTGADADALDHERRRDPATDEAASRDRCPECGTFHDGEALLCPGCCPDIERPTGPGRF